MHTNQEVLEKLNSISSVKQWQPHNVAVVLWLLRLCAIHGSLFLFVALHFIAKYIHTQGGSTAAFGHRMDYHSLYRDTE